MKKLLNVIVVVLCVLMCMPICVYAASSQLMTYKGIGISNKSSVNSFNIKNEKKVKINHKTTSWYRVDGINTSNLFMEITVLKKGYLFYSDTGKKFKVYSTNKKTKTYTLEKGTYKLHFLASRYAANISGNVVG
nr:hypothetical protein [uncultured Ruminococcus sp.]